VDVKVHRQLPIRRQKTVLLVLLAFVLSPGVAAAQGLTGALIGTVKDDQGGVLPSVVVRLGSPALIGGLVTLTTNERGQLRFPSLPPGVYELDITMPGFATLHEADILIGAGATIERTVVLKLAGIAESVVVEGAGSRIDARNPGFGTRFGPEDIKAIPTRRASMFDWIRAAPGISPTSPSSGTATTVSAFGSGANENQFLIDGTNFTCPCNGIARAEPGVDFIQEVQVQSTGASAEFGNVQGAVINVVTRQGSVRLLYDASYYSQTAGLTSQPVLRRLGGPGTAQSGYERDRYRDLTTNLGGPVVRDRAWFFIGYQYLRDYDSQPGTYPNLPRTYEQNKVFAKLTWQPAPGWQLDHSLHNERWVNPEQPTLARPFATTVRAHAWVPAMTFGHLTHTSSANRLWDVRVGRFVYSREDDPSTGDRTTPARLDNGTNISSGAPQELSALTLIRTSAKATVTQYRAGLWGVDHEWKLGVQFERGEHREPSIIPTGVRYVDTNRAPVQAISSAPSNSGGVSLTSSGFISDALTLGNRLTVNAGLRFDQSRAISQDLHAVDVEGRETNDVVSGLGTLYTWIVWSPRMGVTAKVTSNGRTMLRASYGRFSQGVLTGEIGLFHPAVAPITTMGFESATGGYTSLVSVVDNKVNLELDRDTRAPHTDEYSVGLDRELGQRVAVTIAYVRKDGANFIGWTDIGGQYLESTRTLADGRSVPVFELINDTRDRRFLLTNQDGYEMTYDGLVLVVNRRRSNGWQAFASYTLSRTSGLQPSSATNASGTQVSTIAPSVIFGRDPNDLTNAHGRLPGDRPHAFRAMGSVEVPRTGMVIAASMQYFSGKPWAAVAVVGLPQTNNQATQRVQLEARGSRRLSSQALLDMRVSKTFSFGGSRRIELLVDVLNVLNDTAEEGLVSENLFSSNFGLPNRFVDPRRAMVGVRVNLGR
jgi:hypothetical protein